VIFVFSLFCWATGKPLVVLKMLLPIKTGTRKIVEVACFKILKEGEG